MHRARRPRQALRQRRGTKRTRTTQLESVGATPRERSRDRQGQRTRINPGGGDDGMGREEVKRQARERVQLALRRAHGRRRHEPAATQS